MLRRELLHPAYDLLGRRAPRDVVGALVQDHVTHPGLRRHVAAEPAQGAIATARPEDGVLQNLVGADPGVGHRHVPLRARCGESVRQVVGPPVVRVAGGADAVGDGVAEGDDGARGALGAHVDPGEEGQVVMTSP